MAKMTSKQRQNVPLKQIRADKKPYVLRGEPRMVLYLTNAQAANRHDLIPQQAAPSDQEGIQLL